MRRFLPATVIGVTLLAVLRPGVAGAATPAGQPDSPETQLRAVLLPVEDITETTLDHYQTHHVNAVVLDLAQIDHPRFAPALGRVRQTGLDLYYWIEVGRDVEAAREHRDWLHRPHKIQHYGEPVVIEGWVCINNQAVFDHQRARVKNLVERAGVDDVRGLLLNDVLGAPEGCGCGNALCRLWDGSPGAKISGGTGVAAFGNNPVAPRLFAERVSEDLGGLETIPVVTQECEGGINVAGVDDPERTLGFGRMSCRAPCAVDSYGRLIAELEALPRVGLLALYRTFGRDAAAYGGEAAWIGGIVERYLGHDPEQTVITVLEGWDVTPAQVEAQIAEALAGGAGGFVIAARPIDQTWQVKPLKPAGKKI